MKRLPSIKTTVLCGFAAVVASMSIPGNLLTTSETGTPTDAIATMASTGVNATGNGTSKSNGSNGSNRSNGNNTTNGTPPGKDVNPSPPNSNSTTPQPEPPKWDSNLPKGWGYTKPRTAKLRVHVIDGRTNRPLKGAEVVVIETEQRMRTDSNGYTPWIDAPVFRNPKYRPMIAELHGQLGLIVYKNGYRDSIHLGVRMHEDIEQQTTVWMYKIGPQDRRIEPVLYQEPYHHIWLIRLADKFRQKSQMGAGPERP